MLKKIKLIVSSIRQYKKYAIITPFFMLFEAGIECCLPFFISVFVDTICKIKEPADMLVGTYNDMGLSIVALIIILISLATVSMFCGIMGGVTGAKASVGLAANLRSDYYKKIQSFSFANIDKFSSSSLITRMTTDINNVQQSFQMCIRIVIRVPLMLVFSVVMATVTGGNMVFIFIGLIPLVVLGLALIGKFAISIFIRVFKRYDKLNESVEENVSGIRVVKAYVREEHEKKKFNRASDSMTKDFVKAEKIVALNNPLMNTMIHLSNILVLSIGSSIIFSHASYDNIAKQISYGDLSVGQMSALLTYGIQILSSLMFLSMIFVMLMMSIESVKRVAEVLQEKPTILNPKDPVMEVKDGSVNFNKVDFKYFKNAEKNTLEDIDLHIKSGQFIGILGATGSGKTSVINLISRLYDVTDGSVTVGGVDVREYDIKTLRDNVAVVLQKNVLFSGTIASNLQWGDKEATEEEMYKALDCAQATEIVKNSPDGLNRVVEQGGANFSGGQKQRLCIARAILKKPKILILDDSTSAVDTKTDKLIRKALKEDLPHMTKIVIAQRISSIEDADQIVVMDDGHIDAVGTHDDLLKNNKIYQEVYYSQNRVGGDK